MLPEGYRGPEVMTSWWRRGFRIYSSPLSLSLRDPLSPSLAL